MVVGGGGTLQVSDPSLMVVGVGWVRHHRSLMLSGWWVGLGKTDIIGLLIVIVSLGSDDGGC